MLRRTLILFVAFVLLVLAITVGYALLGLSGPRTAIADADRALADRKLGEAVRMLDIAARTLTDGDHDELLPQILRRRYRAHHKLGNVLAARRDIEALLALTPGIPPEPQVAVEHIEILIADDQADAGLQVARSLLERATGAVKARTMELAGEAHQAIYQSALKRLVKQLDDVLAESSRQDALALLKSLLYRTADDPVAVRAQRELYALVRHQSATAVSLDGWQGVIDGIRAGIQQALAHFKKSLEFPDGKPIAAFHGVMYALEQSGRLDERRAVQALYLRRFNHVETVRAAVTAAEERLAETDYAGAVEIAEHYLPPGTALARAEADRFPRATKRLMVTQARALLALKDWARLEALMDDVNDVQETKLLPMVPEYFLVRACLKWEDSRDVKSLLAEFFTAVRKDRPSTSDGYDLYQVGVDLQLRWLNEHGRTDDLGQALDAWCLARPDDVRARRKRCEHLLAAGRPDLAIADAAELIKHRTRDDDALALYVRAVNEAAVTTNRDAASMLARLAARSGTRPTEPHDPAIYLALGELAMKGGQYHLAKNCGQLAALGFQWAEWPRRMATEAALQLDEPIEALRAAETYREFYPYSDTALRLYGQALAKNDRKDPGLLFETALHRIANPALAETLLTAAITRDQRAALPALCRRSMYRYGTDAKVMLRAAMGLLVANRIDEARDVLINIPAAFPADHAACVEAATRFLLLEAKDNPASPMLGITVATLVLHALDDAATLLRVAAELEQAGQPALVLDVLAPLLEDEAHVEGRNGRVFTLAGRACLALDQIARAELHLTAAMSFPDGRTEAAPSLALLWLLNKQRSDAESAIWETQAVDEASACLLLSMGRPEPALAWARGRLRDAPVDVSAMLILVLAGNPDDKRSAPAGFHALVRKDEKEVLKTLTLMAMPGFRVMGEKAAAALHKRNPGNSLAWFLYARALSLVGKRDEAVAQLIELTQQEPGFFPAYDEVLKITDGGLRGDISKISPLISNSVVTAPHIATPRMRAMVGEAFAAQIGIQKNNPERALPMLARLWIQFPQESRASLENVAALTIRGRTDDAFELLRQLESQLPESERSRYLDFYFTLGRALVKGGETKVVAELESQARRVVDTEGAFGAAVHYLVDRLEETSGPLSVHGTRAAHADQAEALLVEHLEFVPELRDLNTELCLRTIDRLEQIEPTERVLNRIDELLRRDPSLLMVWLRRAQLLETREEYGDALDSLRWISDYIAFEPAMLEFARIAGEHRVLSSEDAALIEREVKPEDRGIASAAFAMGVVAFRQGRLEEAADLLATAPPRTDGGHLFFAGMVAIARHETEVAREAFAELAESYPESEHAMYAGHLAEQLGHVEE